MGSKTLKPIILSEKTKTRIRSRAIFQRIDIYKRQCEELFEITNPALINNPSYKEILSRYISRRKGKGVWIYFPWNGTLLHTVPENEYNLLRTNRNKNLITQQEQVILSDACIGFAGLSVGSSVATTLAYQGIGTSMKLAEFDVLSTTNLNRMRAIMKDVGKPKIDIVANALYDINPFLRLTFYPQGMTTRNLPSFIHSHPKPDLIFEIIDDFEMKIRLRLEARKAKIPVIMMANLGDSVLIDIERYDVNPKLPLFNGVIGNLPETILEHPDEDKHKYAVAIVGKENVPKRALESVMEIGKTLVGRPQLGSTVTTAAGLAAYLARTILLKDNLPSGRYRITFSDLFTKKHNCEARQKQA
jgi:hypothetical protein